MNNPNDFMKLRNAVNNAVSQYLNLRKKIGWQESGKSATIQRLAKPFLTGYFTIAIAGKMSAGKSTFINSLIGENLLPTGYFQTTSGITWIVYSKQRFMEVTFADGRTVHYKTNFAQELRKLVAVPEEFDALPINDINNLIVGNNSINTILQKKAGIEVKTGTSSNDALWRKYVNATPKSKIAKKVVIHWPLPKEYEGWRIVDTPGVGAIGGIQEATMNLLTERDGENNQHVVDAVILLHKGTENIQDESANKFAEDVSKSMGDLAKGRLFFVLTHASSPEFLNNKEGILSRAENLFGRRLDIPKDKITYVDSFVQRFISDAKKSGKDFSNPKSLSIPLNGWTQEEWKSIKIYLSQLYLDLMDIQGKECTNSTIFSQLESTARFDVLRDKLNDFLNNEKEATFNRLMNLIEDELKSYNFRLQQDIHAVSNGSTEIEKQIKEAEQEDLQLKQVLLKLQQRATPAAVKKIFDFVDTDLGTLSAKKTIQEVRAAYLQIIAKGINAEKDYFKALISDFEKFSKSFENTNMTLKRLDLDAIEKKAHQLATSQVTDYSRAERKLVKEGGWSSDDQYETYYPHTKSKVDSDKKLREFIASVIKEGRSHYKSYIDGVEAKCQNFLVMTSNDIDDKKKNTIDRLKDFEARKAEKAKILGTLNEQLAEIKKVQTELNKYSD